MGEKITKDTLIGEAVREHPEIADVFLSYGLHCVGCHVNAYETIEQGSLSHGMTAEEVDEMVVEANKYLEQVQEPAGPLKTTPRAISKLKELAKEENKALWGLRIGVQTKDYCDASYELEFEEKAKQDDTTLNDGFLIFLDKATADYLLGATLDYVETANGAGFKINTKQCKH